MTEQAAEAPARDGEATAPATGTEDAGQEKAPAAPEAATAAEAETDQDAQPAVPLPEGAEIINGEAVVHGTVEKGDTVSKIIEGNTSSGSHPYVSAARQVFSMRAFRTGQPYTIVVDPASGQLKRFEYEIDASRRLVVEGAEEPVARVEPIEYVTTLAQVEATIDDNLFQAVADIGESPQLALTLGSLFGSEINFICNPATVSRCWWKNATVTANTRAMAACWPPISPTRAPPTRPICSATARTGRSITTPRARTCARPCCRRRWPSPA